MIKYHKIVFLAFLLLIITFSNNADAATYSFSDKTSIARTTYQHPASFQTYYSGGQIDSYWPILGNKESCEARQDVLLQVAPGGCQPAVVRSDLLAEQNVPVFCQIDALTINPLIDIKEIRNIRFSGTYPKEVIGAGFHPARAAIRTRDKLLGEPLINNIGYVVIVLKKNEIEKDIPSSITANLAGVIEYDTANSFGVGRAEFILEQVDDEVWEQEKLRNSFWKGRYFIRLEQADSQIAIVSLYYGDRKISTQKVERGKLSPVIYMPGYFCQAGVQVSYEGFLGAQKMARLEVSDGESVESFDVYRGSRFLNDKCEVVNIQTSGIENSGNVTISCRGAGLLGSNKIVLQLHPSITQLFSVLKNKDGSIITSQNGNYYTAKIDGKTYGVLERDKNLYIFNEGNKKWEVARDLRKSEQQRFAMIAEALNLEKSFSLEQKEKAQKNSLIFEDTPLQTSEAEQAFAEAIRAYEQIADEYPAERAKNHVAVKTYGEEALQKALELAQSTNGKKQLTVQRVLEKLVQKYPDSPEKASYEEQLREFYSKDSTRAEAGVDIDGKFRTISLTGIRIPDETSSAVFSASGNGQFSVNVEENSTELSGDLKRVYLDKVIDEERVQVRYYCSDAYYIRNQARGALRYASLTMRIQDDAEKVCGDVRLKLESVNLKEFAKVKLTPYAKGTSSQTNLTVRIGIEKRLIKLSPDKTEERINALNESVEKWESISKNLGNVVKGLKAACFATSATLTVKNFISGVDGTALARQQVMQGEYGWTARCKYAVDNKRILQSDGSYKEGVEYKTLTECFNGEKESIRKEVELRQKIIEEANEKISEGETKKGDFTSGYSVDSISAQKNFILFLKKTPYANESFVQSLQEPSADKPAPYSYEDLRDWYLQRRLADEGISFALDESKRIEERVKKNDAVLQQTQTLTGGLGGTALFIDRPGAQNREAGLISVSNGRIGEHNLAGPNTQSINENVKSATNALRVRIAEGGVKQRNRGSKVEGGEYLLFGKVDAGVFVPQKEVYTYSIDEKTKTIILNPVLGVSASDIYFAGDILNVKHSDSPLFGNRIQARDAVVRYFETGPDKGLPARVPFDVLNGWYADVQSNLRIGNQIAAYDASGLPKSWKICNVGGNGIIDLTDNCGLVNVGINYDAPLLGLSREQSRQIVEKSQRALLEAARQKGNKIVNIDGQQLYQGVPMTQFDSVQCQDFMSPEDCKLLFNVCDPVICPATRCNFGGKYPVADVIQTGIVGGALLCLPNYQEGIYIPVCLSGISAGIESYVSVLKSHRDCLQENLNSGRMIGICDELYSIYACEFFWRQIAPVANVLLPKLVELAYGQGQGARGGGEYLTVMGAWENTRKSIDYFRQTYAVNSLKAFRARSIEEAGGEFCKGFVSLKSPKSFKSLIEPDSPPQFYAYFDSITYTTATVPATAQYKVYYHIFAGSDAGVYYNVYLKNPPEASYYYNSPQIQVANGFLAKGQSADFTRDFTAPEGYKELCVRINDEERCGFKQVTTDFAVNYLRDKYIQSEGGKTDIKSERECISGSPNLGAVITPSLQAGLEESALPQVAERGIIRICSTRNPGESTEPARYVDVGYCDNDKMRCWMDKKSVSNAITDSNKGVRNETLSVLEERQRKSLIERGALNEEKANGLLADFARDVEAFIKGYGAGYGEEIEIQNVKTQADALLKRMDETLGQKVSLLIFNHHKAQALTMQARVKDVLARVYLRNERKNTIVQTTSSHGAGGSLEVTSSQYSLENGQATINGIKEIAPFITSNGKTIPLYLFGGKIWMYERDEEVSLRVSRISIGSYSKDGRIEIDEDKIKSEYDSDNIAFLSDNMRKHLVLLDNLSYKVLTSNSGIIKSCKVEIYQNGVSVSSGSFDEDIEAVISDCRSVENGKVRVLLELSNGDKRVLEERFLISLSGGAYTRAFKFEEVVADARYVVEVRESESGIVTSDVFVLNPDSTPEYALIVEKGSDEVPWNLILREVP